MIPSLASPLPLSLRTYISGPFVAPRCQPMKALVIFFHGYGAHGHNVMSLAPAFQYHGYGFWAPHGLQDHEHGSGGRQWFSLKNLDWSGRNMANSLRNIMDELDTAASVWRPIAHMLQQQTAPLEGCTRVTELGLSLCASLPAHGVNDEGESLRARSWQSYFQACVTDYPHMQQKAPGLWFQGRHYPVECNPSVYAQDVCDIQESHQPSSTQHVTAISGERLVPIVFAGFSQGAALAMHVGLFHYKTRGVLGFSGFYPLMHAPVHKGPVFSYHGEEDSVVPIHLHHMAMESFAQHGISVQHHIAPAVDHSIDEGGLQRALTFLEEVV